MAIIKEITTPSGVTTSYHIINNIVIDRVFNRVDIQVSSYIDIEARRTKKVSVTSTYYEVPFEVYLEAIINNKDILTSLYDYLHKLDVYKDGIKELSHIQGENLRPKEEPVEPVEPLEPVEEILVLKENSIIELKPNTTYEITNNIDEIIASGVSISIRYNLYYINNTNELRLNRIEYHNTNKITAPAKIVFTTNNNDSSHILSLILDGVKYGSLNKDIEYYIKEV